MKRRGERTVSESERKKEEGRKGEGWRLGKSQVELNARGQRGGWNDI